MSYIGERIIHGGLHKAPAMAERKKKNAKERGRSDLKDGKLYDSGKEIEDKAFHKLHVLGMNDDLWETWKGCEWVELQVVLTRLRKGRNNNFITWIFLWFIQN